MSRTVIQVIAGRKIGYFAIVPSIAWWRGDIRRDASPYMTTLGCSYGDLNIANYAMRQLTARGIRCHLETLERWGD